MIIDHVYWFTPMTTIEGLCVGVLLGRSEIDNEKQGYIGIAYGINEEYDIKMIAQQGARIVPGFFKQIVAYFEEPKPNERTEKGEKDGGKEDPGIPGQGA